MQCTAVGEGGGEGEALSERLDREAAWLASTTGRNIVRKGRVWAARKKKKRDFQSIFKVSITNIYVKNK